MTVPSTEAENVVGAPGEGWRVAMGTLAFERGVSTLAQQMHFRNELNQIIEAAKANGSAADPVIRQRIAKAWRGLQTMRASALRMLSGTDSGLLSGPQFTYKIYWATWHRALGELAMDVLGQAGRSSFFRLCVSRTYRGCISFLVRIRYMREPIRFSETSLLNAHWDCRKNQGV